MGALVKDSARIEVQPSVPASPAVEPIACKVYAPALPRGWKYRTPPASGADFAQWAPRYRVMLPVTGPLYTVVYVPVAAWETYPYDPATQSYTTSIVDGILMGFWVITTTYGEAGSVPDTLNYWYTAGITHIQFDDYVAEGPPPGPVGGTYLGRINIWPSIYTARFTKDSNGFMRALEAFNIPYSQERSAYGLLARIDVPGRDAQPAVRAVYETDYRIGWNAGADSDDSLDGDVHVVFEPSMPGAGAVGFARDRGDFTVPETLSHAFYFDSDPTTGRRRFCVSERGRRISGFAEYSSGVSFEIRREGAFGTVTYLYDGDLVCTSAAPLYEAIRVGTALYRAGDGVL